MSMNTDQTFRLFYKLRGVIIACIVLCVLLIPLSIIFVKRSDIRVVLPISFALVIPALLSMYKKGKEYSEK